jgi:hypothetical protein
VGRESEFREQVATGDFERHMLKWIWMRMKLMVKTLFVMEDIALSEVKLGWRRKRTEGRAAGLYTQAAVLKIGFF